MVAAARAMVVVARATVAVAMVAEVTVMAEEVMAGAKISSGTQSSFLTVPDRWRGPCL